MIDLKIEKLVIVKEIIGKQKLDMRKLSRDEIKCI